MNKTKFTEYLRESYPSLQDIMAELETMSEDEIDEFGAVLYDEFFADDDDDEWLSDTFFLDDIIEMVAELGEECYEDIMDMLSEEEPDEPDDPDELDVAAIDETVSRRMKPGDFNRKKRKYMGMSRAELRQTRTARKRDARQNRQARRRYYRANRKKIAMYQKTRRAAIASGKHKPKVRKPA